VRKTTGYYREIARAYAEMADWSKALEFYKKALEVFPEIPEGAMRLRADYENLKNTIKELEREVAIYENQKDAIKELGREVREETER
jgi:tetratricopeptide (TPR) repeat protein